MNKQGITLNENYLKFVSSIEDALKIGMVKKCPACDKVVFQTFKVCPYCDYVWGPIVIGGK